MTTETAPEPSNSNAQRIPHDIRPMVARSNLGPSTAVIVAGVVLVGLLLFAILEARRQSRSAPATFPTITQADLGQSPPPLYIPAAPPEPPIAPSTPVVVPAPAPLFEPRQPALPARAPVSTPPTVYAPPTVVPAPAVAKPRTAGGAAIIIDNTQPRTAGGTQQANASSRLPGVLTDRTRSGMLANRSATVPQGTLIQAVLETAFDSTSPGFARALVQRDVRGFDGSRVLIPRGSRLIGEYRSDTGQGQKRVIIVWARLIRPDGVTVALASPATDPVGRGGVRAEVDNHFWERFSGAILQSSFDLGIALAARNSGTPVVIAGSVSNSSGNALPQPTTIPPTLKVAAGKSISVFVARDLDFTGAAELP